MPLFEELVNSFNQQKNVYEPVLLRLDIESDRTVFNELVSRNKVSYLNDTIEYQLKELIKGRTPSVKFSADESDSLITAHLNGRGLFEYGVWAYYPWNQAMVHLLDKTEFIEVRTNRNQHKITKAETDLLNQKKIGIAGLSVGHSIALTLATERCCGELRLADFDELELSNLNRIRSGVQNLGVPKVVIAAREIAEIDPYLTVRVFSEGLQKGNMDQFFLDDGKLDLFIEVCDSIEIKVDSRLNARQHQIPVVMDTNDRGMLDVERFDLEPGRPLLHGLIDPFLEELSSGPVDAQVKMKVLMALVSFDTLSERLKYSMQEIGKSITTWPQLASSVVLGGAITADISRKILLNQHTQSGRYYVDLDELLGGIDH